MRYELTNTHDGRLISSGTLSDCLAALRRLFGDNGTVAEVLATPYRIRRA